jgi:hypothetical protein
MGARCCRAKRGAKKMAIPETYCCICGERLAHDLQPHELAENNVFKCGELSYIELAHRACAVAEDGSGIEWDYDALESDLDRRVDSFIRVARMRAFFRQNDQRIARATAQLAAIRTQPGVRS